MTILDPYAPEEFAITEAQEYSFTFPAVDDASIEVYEIIEVDAVEYQYLVPYQEYQLDWNIQNHRYPLKRNGTVTFSRPHSVGTNRVMIVRNTLMDQTVDMPPYSRFNSRMVEFALDKHTMIFQEIAQRKCNASTVTPITQEVEFGAYDDFKASVMNFVVQKLYDIAAEIEASADDCSDNLAGT